MGICCLLGHVAVSVLFLHGSGLERMRSREHTWESKSAVEPAREPLLVRQEFRSSGDGPNSAAPATTAVPSRNSFSEQELPLRSSFREGEKQLTHLPTPVLGSSEGSSPVPKAPAASCSGEDGEKEKRAAWSPLDVERGAFASLKGFLCEAKRRNARVSRLSFKEWPHDRRDELVENVQQAAEAVYDRMGEQLNQLPASCEAKWRVDCADKRWNNIFTGKLLSVPETIVELLSGFQGGAEVGLLEIRLHEFHGVVDVTVVGEGQHNHRGDKKRLAFPRFENTLFKLFRSRIEYVVMENGTSSPCKKYAQRLREVRASARLEKDEWSLQNRQRECIWSEFLRRRPDIPGSAIVVFSDLDEVPTVDLLANLKFCELRSPFVEKDRPLNLVHKEVRYNLRSAVEGCQEKLEHASVQRKRHIKIPVLKYATGQPVEGGSHLTYFGSVGQVMHKLVNHAEGGGLPSFKTGGVKPDCHHWPNNSQVFRQAAATHFDDAARMLRDDPVWMTESWRKVHHRLPRGKVPGDCGLPRFLLDNAWRYPSFFGM